MKVKIIVPERVPFTVPAGRKPTEADIPAVTWRAEAEAISVCGRAVHSLTGEV